jgi:nucleoside-diphosphate-sugar epimerase
MSDTTGLHVVLGAGGGAGNAIAQALHAAGLPTRAVNRSGAADLPGGIELLGADIATPEGAARAVAGAAVVYMAAQPPYHRWPEEFPAMLRTATDATAATGAKFVMVDNLYSYGPGAGTINENTPRRANDSKGKVRREMIRTLLDLHHSQEFRVAIGQASDYFGPYANNSAITALAIEPVARGKTIRWTGSLDAPHSVAYLPDIARAYVQLGTSDRADGEVWILPHGEPATGRAFLDQVNGSLPQPLKTGLISKAMLRLAAPFHKISRETLGILYQWTEPFVVDDAKFQKAFGPFTTTPLAEAVGASVEWYRSRGD